MHNAGEPRLDIGGDAVACGLDFTIWEVSGQGTRVLPLTLAFWLHTVPPTWRALWRFFTGSGFDLKMRISLGGDPDRLTQIPQPLLDFVSDESLHDACLAFFRGLKEDMLQAEEEEEEEDTDG